MMAGMIKTTGIDSLTNFQKNAKSFATRLEETKEPLVLTVNGKAKLVIQDAEAYQAMLDELERSRFIEAVKQGLKESQQGLGRPAEEVFAEMKTRYGL
jgi:PHD/YefM family antitoxin component YafN of YafNO toxin-antitoxin module